MRAPKFFTVVIPLLAIVTGCASTRQLADSTYNLIGTARYEGSSLPSGEVMVMRGEPGGAVHKTAVLENGSFEINLPSGPYFLMGSSQDTVSGKKLFAFWANNPLRLFGDMTDAVVLPFVESTPPPVIVEGGKGITGKVLFEGRPVQGALVGVFLDASGEFRGLPYAESAATDSSGRFILNVTPGRYFVLARFRVPGGSFQGPLLRGDLAGFYPHNPVTLREGEGLIADLPMVKINRPRGEGSLAHGEAIIIEGSIQTITGEPAAGMRMVLYDIPEMVGRPAFISSPSDDNGRYRLEVSRGGLFYAAARSVIGRPSETGELMGFYDGTEDHSLTLEVGDRVQGVDIVVREVW
ncbi:MAG: hypothetical protein P1S46_02485 [bacterium]|nr:hypothetical protein [bacterium]